jgi:hypothetical protein
MLWRVLVLGLSLPAPKNKRTVCGIVLDTGTDRIVATIRHVTVRGHAEAQRARDAHDHLASALSIHTISAAVLLEADFHARRGLSDGVKDRLRLEGACLAACQGSTPTVVVMDGQAMGRAVCGGTKDEGLAAAEQFGAEADMVEATAAALAAKSLV